MNIEELIEDDFSGCIFIKKDDDVIFEQAYGYADLSNKVSNKIDTKFATASAGKVFVAVAILQLIEKGKLKMSDTIGNLLKFDLHDIDKDITIEQLLTHKSGIPDYFDETIMDEYEELWRDYPNYKIRKSSDLLPLFITKPMMYPKGEKFQYNNTGFVVLGLIIEAITKMPFDEYLKKNIFDVIGMHSTGYYELDRLPAKCANNYIFDEERKEYYTNIYSVDVKGTGAGGAFTTVGDIECFWRALLSNKLLSYEMTKKMLSVQSTCEDDDNYGYGIWLNKNSKNNSLPYFTGSDPGVSFISSYDLEENLLITIVSNFGDNVWKMMKDIRKVVSGIKSYEFKAITNVEEIWNKVVDFAQNCSWRAGKSLAQKMIENKFEEWERVIVAIENENIAGFCTFTKKDSIQDIEYTPYIGYMFVSELYRGERLSEGLIKAAINYAKKIGFNEVYIVSGEIGLYEKYGFVKIDEKYHNGSMEQIFMKKF